MGKEGGMQVLAVIKEHITNRGLGFAASQRHLRRPRTAFFTVEGPEHIMQSDIAWEIRAECIEEFNLNCPKEQKDILLAHFSRSKVGSTDHLPQPEVQDED